MISITIGSSGKQFCASLFASIPSTSFFSDVFNPSFALTNKLRFKPMGTLSQDGQAIFEGGLKYRFYLMGILFVLTFLFLDPDAWIEIFSHHGLWKLLDGVAYSFWSTYYLNGFKYRNRYSDTKATFIRFSFH